MDQIQMDPCPSNAASAGNMRSQMFPSESQRHQGRYTSTVASIQIACNEGQGLPKERGVLCSKHWIMWILAEKLRICMGLFRQFGMQKIMAASASQSKFPGRSQARYCHFHVKTAYKMLSFGLPELCPKKDESSTDPKKMVPYQTAFSRRDLRDNFVHPKSSNIKRNDWSGNIQFCKKINRTAVFFGLSPLPVIVEMKV